MAGITSYNVVFGIIAAIIVGSAILVVTLKNIIHSALFLGLSFLGVASLYILLNAEFIAAAQVLIYVGAITVLILFGVMLTHRVYSASIRSANELVLIGFLISAALLMLVLVPLYVRGKYMANFNTVPATAESGVTANLAAVILTRYLLPFEIASIVLIVSLVGAIVLAYPTQKMEVDIEDVTKLNAEEKEVLK